VHLEKDGSRMVIRVKMVSIPLKLPEREFRFWRIELKGINGHEIPGSCGGPIVQRGVIRWELLSCINDVNSRKKVGQMLGDPP